MFRNTTMIISLILLCYCFSCGNSNEHSVNEVSIQDAASVPELFDYRAIGITEAIPGGFESLGILIAPDIAISDAHTFCKAENREKCCKRAKFYLQGSDPVSGDVFIHPLFNCKVGTDSDDSITSGCGDYVDLAIIRLDHPIDPAVSIVPMTIEPPHNRAGNYISKPIPGEEYILFSTFNFKEASNYEEIDLKRLVTTKYILEKYMPDEILNPALGIKFVNKQKTLHHGDSGGPLINSTGRIVGVAAGAGMASESESGYTIIYTPLYLHYDWIASHMAVSIFNEGTHKCMEVGGWNWSEKVPINQWDCHGDSNQLWTFEYATSDEFMLISLENGLCLEIRDWSTSDGGILQQDVCNGGANQLWRRETVFNLSSAGYEKIISVNSGKVLSVNTNANGDNVYQSSYNDLPTQNWKFGVPKRLIAKHSNKCIEVGGGSTDPGANINQWECTGSNHQLWYLDEVIEIDDSLKYCMVMSLKSGMCMTSTDSGGVKYIYQSQCSYGDNQLWRSIRQADGSVSYSSAKGGGVLGIYNQGLDNGDAVVKEIDIQSFFTESPIDNLYFIQSHDGKYIYAKGAHLYTDRSETSVITTAEADKFNVFRIIDLDHLALENNNIVTFKTWLFETYLGADPQISNGELKANWDHQNRWTEFKLLQQLDNTPSTNMIMHDTEVSIEMVVDPQHLLSEDMGSIYAAGSSAGTHEIFRLIKVARMRKKPYW